MINLDDIDLMLIEELQQNGKQSIKQLAEKINLSITPTHERIKKIEASGLIKKYVAIIDPEMIGKKLTAYCHITLVKHQDTFFKEFEDYFLNLDEVVEFSYIAGSYDCILKIILRDMEEYQNFILNKISHLNFISNIQSSFVIKQVKNETAISVK